MEKNEMQFKNSSGVGVFTVEYQWERNESEPDVGFIGGIRVEITGAYTSVISQFIDNDGDVEIIFDIPLEQLDIIALTEEIEERLSKY